MTLDRRFCLILSLLLLLVASSVPVFGADSPVLDRVLKANVLKVGMSGNQAPMNFKDRNGNIRGLESDLANMLTTIMDVELQMVVKPFPELLPALKAGEVDMVMSGLTITPQRTADISFIGPYMVSGKSILTKSKVLAEAGETQAINRADLKIAALENSNSQSFIEKYISEATFVPCKDYDTAVQLVINDEVDMLLADMPICLLTLMRYPDADLVTLQEPLTIEPLGIAISSSDPQFLNLVENYLRTLENMGLMDAIRTKWLENAAWLPSLP